MYMPSRERTLRYPELQEVSAACYNILRKYYKTIFQQETIMKKDELRYLQRLAELYPTIGRASTEIINLQSIDVYKRQFRHRGNESGASGFCDRPGKK